MGFHKTLCRFLLTILNLIVFVTISSIIFQYSLYFVSKSLKLKICENICTQITSDCLLTSCKNPKCYKLELIDILVIIILHMKLLSQLFPIIGFISNSFGCKLYLASIIFNSPWIAFNIYDYSELFILIFIRFRIDKSFTSFHLFLIKCLEYRFWKFMHLGIY
jgi:hypothetical protein